MNTENWHWPQFVLLGLLILQVLVYAARDGKPRPNVDVISGFLGVSFEFYLLYAGGFFK